MILLLNQHNYIVSGYDTFVVHTYSFVVHTYSFVVHTYSN